MLVFDNAVGIIESKADRASFLHTLTVMRILSDNNMTVVMTSRTKLRDLLSLEEVTLSLLSHQVANRGLNSCVNSG